MCAAAASDAIQLGRVQCDVFTDLGCSLEHAAHQSLAAQCLPGKEALQAGWLYASPSCNICCTEAVQSIEAAGCRPS